MAFVDPAALATRARNLAGLNGMRLVLVSLTGTTSARLDVYFYNSNHLAAILADPRPTWEVFPLRGGHRVRAGALTGMLRVGGIAAGPTADSLSLTVAPIGDYSTYTLELRLGQLIDPVFSELPFKFRPGCFSIDCAPEWPVPPPPDAEPAIDYLAKDYDSFRHLLVTAMQQRVAGWTPTSEADLGVVLIDLLSAAGDQLSDFQDRTMNEAYLASARKRVSLARHARLMDYHIYEGNQATTLVALEVRPGSPAIAARTAFFAGSEETGELVTFLAGRDTFVDARVNTLDLYTWDDTRPALAAGDTSADLAMPDQATADAVRELVRLGRIDRLLVQEHLNPRTGQAAGVDRTHRQLLGLLAGDDHSEVLQDPLTLVWLVRVRWRREDQLRRDYCFTITRDSDGVRVPRVARFHGNLVPVAQGRGVEVVFRPEGAPLAPGERHHRLTDPPSGRWGTLAALPDDTPLLYTLTRPRGEVPVASTLDVRVVTGAGQSRWTEVASLVHSDDESRHFAVETDELRRSVLRFGNGANGARLPAGAEVRCWFQSGLGPDGNVGADAISGFDAAAAPGVVRCWNPFDVVDGADREPAEQIMRNAPEAFRARQLRAVTLADYVARAEELPGVSRAAARYMWTGSWRTVRVTIDPEGGEQLTPELRERVAGWLEAVRLLGEDLEIRPPEFVPVVVDIALCARPDTWPEDLHFVLAQELGTGYTPDGRRGFFHPDEWTFGQTLRVSQIEGRLQRIPGIEHVIHVRLRRFDAASPGAGRDIEVGPSEIIQVHDDPDHMERGSIELDIRGGRQ